MTFVGVAGRDDLESIQAFITEFEVGAFTHTIDGNPSVWAAFDVRTQPAFAFINGDGTVEVLVGRMGHQALTERVEALIAA